MKQKAAVWCLYGYMQVRKRLSTSMLILMVASYTYCSTLSRAFIGHWQLQINESTIHPGSQWITRNLEVSLSGSNLLFAEQQSFGEEKDQSWRNESHDIPPSCNIRDSDKFATVRWNGNAVTFRETSVKQKITMRLFLNEKGRLVRKTKVIEYFRGKELTVLDQTEVFARQSS
jgi:hypothetical protein